MWHIRTPQTSLGGTCQHSQSGATESPKRAQAQVVWICSESGSHLISCKSDTKEQDKWVEFFVDLLSGLYHARIKNGLNFIECNNFNIFFIISGKQGYQYWNYSLKNENRIGNNINIYTRFHNLQCEISKTTSCLYFIIFVMQ